VINRYTLQIKRVFYQSLGESCKLKNEPFYIVGAGEDLSRQQPLEDKTYIVSDVNDCEEWMRMVSSIIAQNVEL
jgi:hypothetical protein